MPTVTKREAGEYGPALTGVVYVTPTEWAEKIMVYKDGRQNLRAVCTVKDKDHKVSLAVPLDDPKPVLEQWAPGPYPKDEQALRALKLQPRLVSVHNDFIQHVVADVGMHLGSIHSVRSYVRKTDNARRMVIEIRDKDTQAQSSLNVPYPDLEIVEGKDPSEDSISFSAGQFAFQVLSDLGLNVDRFIEEMQAAPMLWPRPPIDANEPEPFFHDADDISQELYEAVLRHGPALVQWEVAQDKNYGPSVKYSGKPPRPELHRVITMGDDWAKEIASFHANWDTLASAVLGRPTRLCAGEAWTDDGKVIAKAFLAPLVRAHPEFATQLKEDGLPAVVWASRDYWTLDGLVLVNMAIERLVKSGIDFANPAGIMDLKDPSKFLAAIDPFLRVDKEVL